MLPYVLFAYREVPQATVRFSPFQLLYGRDIRRPQDVLREKLLQKPDSEMNSLSYIMNVRNRMETAKEIVEDNAKAAQAKQKAYCDKKAQEMNL